MSADELDDRIRALVGRAVADAPAAPDLPASSGTATSPPPDRRRLVWAGIGIAAALLAGAVLVLTNRADDHSMVAASTTTAGSVTTLPTSRWPDGIAVLVASERGIERVTSENGAAVVTRVLVGVSVDRAFELEDGTIVYQETGGDIRSTALPGGPALVTKGAFLQLEDADAPRGELRLLYRTESTHPEEAFVLGMWFQPKEPVSQPLLGGFGVGYDRFTIVDDTTATAATMDDTGQRSAQTVTVDGGDSVPLEDGAPFQRAGDGAGTIGVLGADGSFVTGGTRTAIAVQLPDPTTVVDLDFRGNWLMVQRADGAGELINVLDGSTFDVPVANGFVSVSRAMVGQPAPTVTTTSAAPTTSASAPGSSLPPVVTSGADGVWELGPNGDVQWTAEPMAFAVKAPDGSMIMQRRAGNGEGGNWTVGDTMPLRQAAPGAPLEDLLGALFPAGDLVAGWWTVHDALTMFDRPLLLLDRQEEHSSGVETPAGALVIVDLSTPSMEEIGEVGGWEEGSSRLHLAENGLIIGETYSGVSRGLAVWTVGGDVPLDAADLGLESQYSDCSNCPRLYTISHDGTIVAWIDGTTLMRWSLVDSTALPDVELGGPSLQATDLAIDGSFVEGYVVYDRGGFGVVAAPPVVVSLDPVDSSELPAPARAAIP